MGEERAPLGSLLIVVAHAQNDATLIKESERQDDNENG
jgi:hypothetical protein